MEAPMPATTCTLSRKKKALPERIYLHRTTELTNLGKRSAF